MKNFKVGDEISVEQIYYTDPGIVVEVSLSGRTVKVQMDHGEIIIFAYCEKVEKFVRQGLTEYEAFDSDYLVHGKTKAININKVFENEEFISSED